MTVKFRLLFVFLCYAAAAVAQERKSVPDYVGHVNDFAGILSAGERTTLEQKLLTYEDSTSTQIAVVIEKSLNGRDKFDRAMDFARGWKVGQEGKNNGIVFYIAVDDHAVFITTADRTQGALTDGEVGEIIRNNVRPAFRKGDYYQGISDALDSIMLALQGEFTADNKKVSEKLPGMFIIILVIIIIIVIIARRGGGTGGYSRGGTYWFPTGGSSWGGSWGGGGNSSGGGWGGFGGGGGFNGGGAGGDW